MDNLFEYPGLRVLVLFFDEPYRDFHLREVAKLAGVSPSTAKRFLGFYVARGFLVRSRKVNLVLFRVDVANLGFRFMKLGYFMVKAESLIRFLGRVFEGSSVVLYGSCARGEDDRESDMDLLVVGKRVKRVDLSRFEKELDRKVTLLVYTCGEWEEKARMDKPFYERILVDGVVLHGDLPVVGG
jgi:predicted nucleotidyltransferase